MIQTKEETGAQINVKVKFMNSLPVTSLMITCNELDERERERERASDDSRVIRIDINRSSKLKAQSSIGRSANEMRRYCLSVQTMSQ